MNQDREYVWEMLKLRALKQRYEPERAHPNSIIAVLARQWQAGKFHGENVRMANLGGGGQLDGFPTRSGEEMRALEIYAASNNTLLVDEIYPQQRDMLLSPVGFRWFWKESLIELAGRFLPHADITIHSVTVSERKTPE